MSAEDKLRDLLRSEATTIVPAGDGLARIRERVERRRRVRGWLLPSAALATAGAAAAFFLFAPDDGRRVDTIQPGGSPSPTTSQSGEPAPTSTPTSNAVQPQPSDSYAGPAYWPFASADDLATVSDPVPAWMQDSLQVGQRLVRDVLKLPGVTVTQTCVSCEVLQLTVGSADVGTIELGHYTVHGSRVFTVVDITGTDLTLTSPQAGAGVSSPTRVTGRITGVDENVRVSLVTQDGSVLSSGTSPAGTPAPWGVDLTWSTTGWSSGALLATTGNMRDGAINRVALVPVEKGLSAAAAANSFAGRVDGHISLFDSTTGARVRQLTYPPSGKHDVEATLSGDSLAWVRIATGKECVNELDRLDAGKASQVAASTSHMFGSPALSPDGTLLVWVETPCGTPQPAPDQLVLTTQGHETQRWTAPADASVRVVDVRNDGSLLIWLHQGSSDPVLRLVRPEDGTTLGSLAYQPDSGCSTTPAAAFVDGGVIGFEDCTGTIRLVHVGPDNRISVRDRAISTEAPESMTVRDGRVLVQLFGGDTYGAIATYANGAFTTVIANDSQSCYSTGSGKGCVGYPSW